MAQGYMTFCKLVIVLFFISVAETRNLNEAGNRDSVILCSSVYGVESGETCSSVAQEFNLSLQDFLGFNPNINCNKIFVGQWLCVDGSASN